MHHAVSPMEPFGPVMQPSLTFLPARRQMVDKVWYDWQHRNPENAKSYFGGSVQALDSVASYDQYPNGGPPFLNVSTFFSCSRPGANDVHVLAEFDDAGGWNVPGSHDRRCDGYDQWDFVLRL
jgi:hypothetical protein